MATSSPARRTNRWLVALTGAIVVIASAVAVFGDRGNTDSTTPSTSPATSIPASPTDNKGRRPAETSLSWFDHAMGVEQYDYVMNDLSCDSIATVITPDLCGVARTSHGDFMLVGTEGFWDAGERDADGLAWVPFDMTVFVQRTDQDTPRASGILDGFDEKAYTSNKAQMDLYTANINGDDVFVLHKRLSDRGADAYSYWESVQVLAATSTGSIAVVATYEGARLHVAATSSSIELSSLRYKTTNNEDDTNWYSRVTLIPSERGDDTWDETVTSGPKEISNGAGMTLLDSHRFPASRATSGPSDA